MKKSDAAPVFGSFANAQGRFPFNWTLLVLMVALHAGAVLALWYVAFWPVIVAVVRFYLHAWVGISGGYHRYFSHRNFKTSWWFERVIALLGVGALQGVPQDWVGMHRYHHRHTDTPEDPISPRHGGTSTFGKFVYSHVGWMLWGPALAPYRKYAPEPMLKDPFYRALVPLYLPIQVLIAAACWYAGGLPMFLWGFCVPVVLGWHVTWAVISVTHLWGDQPYAMDNTAKNHWSVVLGAGGEGWHNNHHRWPGFVNFGPTRRSFDSVYWTICVFERLGLVWDVKRRKWS